ncbi:MAG: hypothetical protein WD118_06670 [Phycisphaeraceae bacterium]
MSGVNPHGYARMPFLISRPSDTSRLDRMRAFFFFRRRVTIHASDGRIKAIVHSKAQIGKNLTPNARYGAARRD